MAQAVRRSLKAEILRLVEKDEEVRRSLASVLSESATLREIAALRQAMDERFETMGGNFVALREDLHKSILVMERNFVALREDLHKSISAMERNFAALREDLHKSISAMERNSAALREDLHKSISAMERNFIALREDLHRGISAIGARWGIMTEEAFRNAMRNMLAGKFGVDIRKWIYYDKEGFVDGLPQQIEADLKISDSEHYLIEVKASVSKGDVSRFKRIGELYSKLFGVVPKLVLVTPFADIGGKALASTLGVEIYTHD